MDNVTLSVAEIHALALKTLTANGCDAENAGPIADNLTRAEADGQKSHGLFRLPGVVNHIREGVASGTARPEVTRTAPAVVEVDAKGGFAPVAHAAGIPVLVETARDQGMAALAIRNCVHIMALWPEATQVAEAGLIGYAFTSSPAYVAPAGGIKPFFGTNPMAFAWPRPGGSPMVFDQASAAMARGEIQIAARDGHPLPEGAGIDSDGNPTTDPEAILKGAQLAFGGYKGASIALMVDLLAGPLLGQMSSHEAKPIGPGFLTQSGELILALNPNMFGNSEGWAAHSERLFAAMTSQEGVRLPGDRRTRNRAQIARDGAEIPKALYDQIVALGES